MKYKSSKSMLFEMVEKINHVKPVLNEEFKIMGSYEGHPAQLVETAQTPEQANALKNEAQLAFGEDFTVWIEKEGQVINESDDKWIQKAVDPAHKGYCTPMTKDTCTPRRKALAKRFKKGIDEELGEKYRAEITGPKEMVWSTNAMEYNTEQEAKDWLDGLKSRWFGYDMGRVVPISTPRNQPVDLENDVIYQNFRS